MRDLTTIETRAIGHAVRSGLRFRHHAYTRDDMEQEAALAVLQARATCEEDYAPQQQETYFARRALGGIKDGLREVLRQDGRRRLRDSVVGARYSEPRGFPRPYEPEGEISDDDSPFGNLAVKRALQAIAEMPEPLPTVAFMRVSGYTLAQISRALEVDINYVYQLQNRLAERLRKHL